MTPGRRPKPTALKRHDGNPGKRGYNHDEPAAPHDLPSCPDHLSPAARDEWHRLDQTLHSMGILTVVDRAALAAYCQAYGRWVEAEEKLRETPTLFKTPSGYVQQSPWLGIANKQMELMSRYMTELGITPASRSRVAVAAALTAPEPVQGGSSAVERLRHMLDRIAERNGVVAGGAGPEMPQKIEICFVSPEDKKSDGG